ncbi:hypothetical protein SAMN05446635_8977 [Burkholderia sp. OK233]|nr:hypothetical protein SAMN05446635_8977 [Burkholderia sp. OK233]
MFDVTPDDINQLSDVDLRELIGRLCEAELANRGLSPVAATWGGHHNAPDGGLDVRVSIPDGIQGDGFIPRSQTGFQVKKPDMPRAEILQEMRPGGALRPVIEDLAQQSGAYVIVSSSGSTADGPLQDRRNAMREALAGSANASQLLTDFYDRTRVASWVRCHPGVTAWVRTKVGRSISGWRPYGPWSGVDGTDGEYLLDDKVRVDLGKSDESAKSVALAIDAVRNELALPRTSIRLVGLSGVGKTRFVQALFDTAIGEHPLPHSLAVYTNLSDNPDPQPVTLVSDLIANRKRAVVIADNCPPDLHSRLTELCVGENSSLSLITVEYDVRDDQPERTHVVRLDNSSNELIEQLVQRRYRELSGVDVGAIAEASGGNARIAIALAETVERSGSITGLSNIEIFKRLFDQRQGSSDALLRAAQACALVYSFDGETLTGDNAELPRLAALAGQTATEIYRHISELLRRDLVQKRGMWRALLPHALANRLAGLALDDIPFDLIEAQFLTAGAERLAQSFSRRLSYLHDHPVAVAIVRSWLQPDGRLGDVASLDHTGHTMFENVAPVLEEATLAALERAVFGDTRLPDSFWSSRRVNLLRSLAYNANLFARSTALLVKIATEGERQSIRKHAFDAFLSLFTIRLSGTRATVEQRLDVIEALLRSPAKEVVALALSALDKMLRTMHFNSFGRFGFGSRSRDYGLWPATVDEISDWYRTVLEFLRRMTSTHPELRNDLHETLARNFRGLWSLAHVVDELESLFQSIASEGFWREGWMACRQTVHFDAQAMSHEVAERLGRLESALRPGSLTDKVRAIVLGKTGADVHALVETNTSTASTVDRITLAASALGAEVVSDQSVLNEILPEVLQSYRWTFAFGRGLIEGVSDRRAVWLQLVRAYANVAPERRTTELLQGFLAALWDADRGLANELYDEALLHSELGPVFPYLQTAIQVDERGADRLLGALDHGAAEINTYGSLQFGGAPNGLSGETLGRLLLKIADQPGGFVVARRVLFMRLHSDTGHSREIDPGLVTTGQILLQRAGFREDETGLDDEFAQIARAVLTTPAARQVAVEVMNHLGESVEKHFTSWSDHEELLGAMFELHPLAVMDTILSDNDVAPDFSIFTDRSGQRANPADAMSIEALNSWCTHAERSDRHERAARIVTFSKPAEGGGLAWSDQAIALLKTAPDTARVVAVFAQRMRPSSWSGSRAAIMDASVQLLDELETIVPASAMPFVISEKERLVRNAAEARQRETEEARTRDERFE